MRTFTVSAERSSPAQMIRLTRFLIRRLGRRPECAAIRDALTSAYTPLVAAVAEREELDEARACATADLEYLDEQLDAAMANFVRHLLAQLGGDRKHPTYLRLFPIAPSAGTAGMATPEQSAFVAGVLQNFERFCDMSGMTEYAAQLQAALRDLDLAIGERSLIVADESAAAGRLNAAAKAMELAFNSAFHELSSLYPGQKGLVRSFYPNRGYERRAPTESPEADPNP